MISDELKSLAKILADWAAPAPTAIIYLYGSRARGDHRPDSDVDIWPKWSGSSDEVSWWMKNNENDFVDINAKLPGKLQILEANDPLKDKIMFVPVTYTDRNVRCVVLPRVKPV